MRIYCLKQLIAIEIYGEKISEETVSQNGQGSKFTIFTSLESSADYGDDLILLLSVLLSIKWA